MGISGVVPARFLTIIAHLVILIVLFWAKDENIKNCLPEDYDTNEKDKKNLNLTVGLSVALGLLLIEIIGFISGLSMFVYTQSLFSTLAHGIGSIFLSMYILESWECDSYWYIFGFCSCIPILTELTAIIYTIKQ